jgi:cyclin B
MEKEMLCELDWNLSRPQGLMFLRRYSKAGGVTGQVHTASKYLLDLSAVHYSLAAFRPSLLAATCLYLSLRLLTSKTPSWTPTLIFYSGYNLHDFAPLLPRLVLVIKEAPKSNLQAVRQAYASPKLFSVSKLPQFNRPFTILDTLIH